MLIAIARDRPIEPAQSCLPWRCPAHQPAKRRDVEQSVRRRPVRFAGFGQRFPCSHIGIGLACLQHDRPVRRLERRTSLSQRPRQRFRRSVPYQRIQAFWRSKTRPKKINARSQFFGCQPFFGYRRFFGCQRASCNCVTNLTPLRVRGQAHGQVQSDKRPGVFLRERDQGGNPRSARAGEPPCEPVAKNGVRSFALARSINCHPARRVRDSTNLRVRLVHICRAVLRGPEIAAPPDSASSCHPGTPLCNRETSLQNRESPRQVPYFSSLRRMFHIPFSRWTHRSPAKKSLAPFW